MISFKHEKVVLVFIFDLKSRSLVAIDSHMYMKETRHTFSFSKDILIKNYYRYYDKWLCMSYPHGGVFCPGSGGSLR